MDGERSHLGHSIASSRFIFGKSTYGKAVRVDDQPMREFLLAEFVPLFRDDDCGNQSERI